MVQDILKSGNRLRILNLGKRETENSSEFKDGDSNIGFLKKDFSYFGDCIEVGDFVTDPITYIQPTRDKRLVLTSMTYYFLVEII